MLGRVLHAVYVFSLGLAGALTFFVATGVLLVTLQKGTFQYGLPDLVGTWLVTTALILVIGKVAHHFSRKLDGCT